MFTFILLLTIFCILLGVGFTITGAIVSALLWLCVQLPVGIICVVIGFVFCVTILFFPVGKFFCKLGVNIMFG